MSGKALLELRKAIITYLAGDTVLATLMGGTVRIYDEPPRAIEGVYAVFGNASASNTSTYSTPIFEQECDVIVWGKAGLASAALAAAERIAVLLHDAPLALNGIQLISLFVKQTDIKRERASGLSRATISLMAVTEAV